MRQVQVDQLLGGQQLADRVEDGGQVIAAGIGQLLREHGQRGSAPASVPYRPPCTTKLKLAISACVVQTWATSMASAVQCLGDLGTARRERLDVDRADVDAVDVQQSGAADRILRAAGREAPHEVARHLGEVAHRGPGRARRPSPGGRRTRRHRCRASSRRTVCPSSSSAGSRSAWTASASDVELQLEEGGKAAKVVGREVDLACVERGAHRRALAELEMAIDGDSRWPPGPGHRFRRRARPPGSRPTRSRSRVFRSAVPPGPRMTAALSRRAGADHERQHRRPESKRAGDPHWVLLLNMCKGRPRATSDGKGAV